MSWKNEIIRGMFVAFGAMQTIQNLTYLLKENGLESARKQHRELPDNITEKQIRAKVICMCLFGILFLATGLFSYFTRSYYELSFILVLVAYVLYALIEAVYYRFWKTFGALILSVILLLVAIFV